MEGDLAFLRKEFKCTIRKYESTNIMFLANLEVKVDKIELTWSNWNAQENYICHPVPMGTPHSFFLNQ